MKIKEVHPLQWIAEPLEELPTFDQRKMFGCEALRLNGRLVLVLAEGEEPWNGLLVCTSREHHESLLREFPALVSHPILGKWLYVSQAHAQFEALARDLAAKVARDDARIGIEPKPRKPRKRSKPRRRATS